MTPGTAASRLAVRVEEADGRPVDAARVCVVGEGGTVLPDGAVAFELDRGFGRESHAVTDGRFEVEVPAGPTTVRVDRGSEFVPAVAEVELGPGRRREVCLRPQRWIDMNAAGWFSGDLHGHRTPADLPRLLRCEGLNFGSSIRTHNGADQWPEHPSMAERFCRVDDACAFSANDLELERLWGGAGAIVGVGLPQPVRFAADAWTPLETDVADQVHALGGLVDAEKPFWPITPALVALGKVDSVGVACNHLGPDWTFLSVDSIGGVEPDDGIRTPARLADWVCEIYHRFLTCGFRLAASGGSASGWMPNPVGHGRTYVDLADRPFTPAAWLAQLRRARSFATTGPMLSLDVDGHGPGGHAPMRPGPRRVVASVRWWADVDGLEVFHDGEVIGEGVPASGTDRRRLRAELAVPGGVGGWIGARAVTVGGRRVDLAHTSPVALAGPPSPRRAGDATFLRRWLERVADRARTAAEPPPPAWFGVLRAACVVYRRLESGASP